MTETPRTSHPPRSTGFAGGFGRTSLFGGAVLATIATASTAQVQVVYVPNVAALGTTTVPSHEFVALGGYYNQGDGGGGTLLPLPTSGACPVDGGIVFQSANQCLTRADPTYSVREWGALCDVNVATAGEGAMWNVPMSGSPSLTIPASVNSAPAVTSPPEFIAISQIGVPTLWGSSTPAVSMTRFSTLSNTGSHYSPGDLVSFAGGTFSQQAAIIVDAVDGNGTITQWHFLWGGVYNATMTPTGTMAQDNAHTFCGSTISAGTITYTACGTTVAAGAAMQPAWSGWSVINNQTIMNGGTGYSVGDKVTFSGNGLIANQGHYPTLIVEATDTTTAVTAYDWLDYGSLAPNSPLPFTLTAPGSHGLTFTNVGWAQAPFTTTITGVTGSGPWNVTLADNPPSPGSPPFPSSMQIQYIYYGHDDSVAIQNAINAAPKGGLIIPAGCGTTKTLNLSPAAAAPNSNPVLNFNTFLKGANLLSSGLFAFAPTPSSRSSTNTVLAHVIQSGVLNSAGTGFTPTPGGGFSNMFIEGLGIPQGYGYWGLIENFGTPSGYVGPTFTAGGTIANYIPTSGNAVEIDASSQMRIDKVMINNGGSGPGNSILQCGLDESDPAQIFVSGSIANITLTDSRLDTSLTGFGATNPDFVVRLGASCHDSVYTADDLFGGTKADVLVYGSNLFSRIHLNSGAANSGVSMTVPVSWPYSQTFGLAGNADYGFYVINNTSVSETQCDIANRACVFTLPPSVSASFYPGQITDTQMKCGSLANTPPGYFGVELSAGTANTTVTGTAPSNHCTIYPFQLVQLDGPVDPSTSLCDNAYASVAGCTGYQGSFNPAQFYTQPAVAYATGTVTQTGLFAVPFFSPVTGGTITKLGIDVTGTTTATQCAVGVYNSSAQTPTSLVAIGAVTGSGTLVAAGTLSVTGVGTVTATLPGAGAELAPGTLYFLAVACNGTATLNGVTSPSSLSVPLVGASARTATASGIVATNTYSATLPNPFPSSPPRTPNAWVPNVYAKP